jgi:hypothetical protein
LGGIAGAISQGSGGISGSGGVPGSGGSGGTGGVAGGGGGGGGSGGTAGTGGQGSGGVSGISGSGGVSGSGGGSGGTAGTGGHGGISSTGGVAGSGGGSGGIAGTGGVGGTGGSTGASLSTLATAFCAAARTCCAKSGQPTSLGDCESSFPSRLPVIALVSKGTVSIDNTALAACIAAYNQTATACTFGALVTGCMGVFAGTKAEGAPCGVGGIPKTDGVHECKPSSGPEMCLWTGDSSDPTVTGVCHKPDHGKSGDACAFGCPSGQDCSSDFSASATDATAICFEDDGVYCNTTVSPSVCTPIVTKGGSCAADSMSCASTSYCDSTTSKCTAAGTIGQLCSAPGSQCLTSLACGSDGKCADPVFGSDSSTCTGYPPEPY